MKTFNFKSNCVKYRDCFFIKGEYEKGKTSLAIFCYSVDKNKKVPRVINVSVNVEDKLKQNEIVIDNYSNSGIISLLKNLGVLKRIIKRTVVNLIMLPIGEIDLDKLDEYCLEKEYLKYA